jgi:hypothetical protein
MTSVQEPVSVREPIGADDAELATLRELRALLAASKSEPLAIVAGEREAAIPPTLLYLLRRLVEHLANERAVRIETFGRDVTPQEAADILGEPIEHVRQLIADGTLVARTINNEEVVNLQLIKLSDLLVYLHECSKRRREGLREMTRMAEEMALYDLDFSGRSFRR